MSHPNKAFVDDRRLDWKSLLLLIVLLPVLVSLGFWQLERADEKSVMLAEYVERQAQPAQWLEQLTEVSNYQPVKLRGVFDPQRYWLLDNRIVNGRFGYEVVALLRTGGEKWVLVNTGWVAGDPGRRSLPQVELPGGEQLISGEVYYPSGGALSLAVEAGDDNWPRVLQWLDMSALREEFGEDLQPFTVRLQPSEHRVVNVSPEKHTGYAVQWFAMAAVLLLFTIWRNSRLFSRGQSRENEDRQA